MPLADTFTQDDFFLMNVVKILRMIPSITSKTEERFLKRSQILSPQKTVIPNNGWYLFFPIITFSL